MPSERVNMTVAVSIGRFRITRKPNRISLNKFFIFLRRGCLTHSRRPGWRGIAAPFAKSRIGVHWVNGSVQPPLQHALRHGVSAKPALQKKVNRPEAVRSRLSAGRKYETWSRKLHLQPKA